MKILELHLAAFGPFTDPPPLTFDETGLHIVYGPNEAGKSSALRGLRALLYGIDERTSDNFRHANEKLRILGCLQTANGEVLRFARRKGRKNTLLDPDGAALDDQALSPFLQGLTADVFETLFGIDHQALIRGGQEILAQRGEVGQALFSAALGSHALHAVLFHLDQEADDLFRPRGSTRKINAALKSYRALSKETRDRSLSSRVWDDHCRALGRTAKELERVQAELAHDRIEINRLQRIQRVLPRLARRLDLLRKLDTLGETVIVPDDFRDRRQTAVKALEMARAIGGKARPRRDLLQQQLEELTVSSALLEQAESIEDLHTRLGSHRKALSDRPHLLAERQQILTNSAALLQGLRPDLQLHDIEQLRLVLAKRQGIAELANEHAVLISRVEQAESSRRDTETRLKLARKERLELPETGSAAALDRTISAARKLGDIDTAIQSTHSELAAAEAESASALARLQLWNGALDDLPHLGLPNREAIQPFDDRYDALERRIQRLREKKDEVAEVFQDASFRLDEIQRVGTVPTESDLIEVRSERDQVWDLLRRQWIQAEDVAAEARHYEADGTLPDVFEGHLAAADELSDRLRREADRVHATASLQARRTAAQTQTADIAAQLEAMSAEKTRIDADWQALWAPREIVPLTPTEMLVWIVDFEKLRDRAGQLQLLRRKTVELERTRRVHIQLINRRLQELGQANVGAELLECALAECEAIAQRLDESNRRRDALEKEVKDRENDLETLAEKLRLATERLDAWKAQWRASMQGFGLPGDTSPAVAGDFIESVRALFAKHTEAEKLSIRIEAIDADAAAFRQQAARMIADVAPEHADLPTEDSVLRLNGLLSENRTRQTKRRQIEEQLLQVQKDIQESDATAKAMIDRLDSLCREANCARPADLEEIERRSAENLEIKAAIESIEQELLETGEGATISVLETEAEGVDADLLPGRIDELSHKIDEELEPRRTELAETKGREQKELEIMDGSDDAAALANQAHAVLAGIRSDAERYVRAKLAGRILRDQIERYRRENQGPLISRAGQHFAALTLESFDGLITDFNDRDEPVLAGTRLDGERVYVEGMSSGTRDQLYLALRLASLEKYMEDAEPMPFIVDDVLVDFDDMRSKAALNALSLLSARTQIVLFTHHSRVVEQAKQLPRPVHVHEL